MDTEATCSHEDEQQEPHYCPYQYDIYNNKDENYCTCCEDCTHKCRMDI